MTPNEFASFYQAVHGHEPFPWQVRLARQVAEQGWPEVLGLPTASGKTSAIDVAVFALALEAGKPMHQRKAPLRVFFVIDRRLVVDQAADHAQQLRRALENPGAAPAVRQVAESLRQFGGSAPLHVAALRGGMYRDDSWAKTPNQPAVCVSTVDQVGSRLLFRGYGLNEYARPVHAGLTGNDALYLVDEAHLSQPFLETLRAVQAYRDVHGENDTVGGPFRVVEISATPQGESRPFTLAVEDFDTAELSRRLATPKPARLFEPSRFEKGAAEFAVDALVGEVKIVGVVVNRVASAREIFRQLPGREFDDKVLLTGRIRPWDRDKLLDRFLERVRAGRPRTPEDKPLFVVATMTVEVGADLDFDHLITEAAPLSALRQRFGRLDRLGRFGQAAGVILFRKSKGPDPIYGDELAETWEWLQKEAAGRDGVIDFGINALSGLIENAATPPPAATARHAPTLFPAHLDAWVQTSPATQPSPDVAPFLHGPDALTTADVQVVWRADLLAGQENDWLEIVAAAPPRLREALPIPLGAAQTWLCRAGQAEVADIEGVAGDDRQPGPGRPALLWRGPDADASRVVVPDEIQPGDTLVVPASYGGADAFGWDPESTEPVRDVGDLCPNDQANSAPVDGRRRLVRLRLYRGLEGVAEEQVQSLRKKLEAGEDYEESLDELLASLEARSRADPLTAAVGRVFTESRPRVTAYPAGVVVTGRVLPGFLASGRLDEQGEGSQETDDSTDTDDASSVRAGLFRPVEVSLENHAKGVARKVSSFVERLVLDGAVSDALKRGAYLHDLGKADARFQFLLYGDEPDEVLLAKSGKDLDARQRELVREKSGLPKGFRHELVSVALVRNHREELLVGLDHSAQELVEYLIGTHHGRGRPFVPLLEEKGEVEPVALTWDKLRLSASPHHQLWRLDLGWADGFWKLVRRHGYWGLAFLETVLRLADTSCSADEQLQREVADE